MRTRRVLAAAALLYVVAACRDSAPDRTAVRELDSLAIVDSAQRPHDAASSDASSESTSSDAAIAGSPATGSSPAASATTDSLRAALERLASGVGESTWFSGETADVLRSATVDANGHAVVDFVDLRDVIPNASSSAGSIALIEELNATVFSVDGVASVEYRMNGSCPLLGEWLQYGECLTFDREQ